ncbi:putative Heterokaryon incompatibility protein 6, OR allele [Glarea lozoyensis 74030]|uniref:Putative Heterokaryon incompatibility protein 6, OR allele n=1 Tax=Glarea lozoyensis (strain ATCC 74030 / MF5533) TaxID=1104152 RepID=H0ERH8_GLAL7|nr:putative Heterokaryon incompatibility protein 6, OR allele [Glarea lozoyensis 74030]
MSTHSYQPLTPRQFRVLRLLPGAYSAPIETTLRHVNLEDKPKFDALSYQWGPESSNNSQILVDKTPFTIRDNLFLFLKRFRASSQNAQELYIDALCINQQDVGEKGHQVAMMSEIYPRAKKVLVWLGEHDEHSQKIFAGAGFQDWVSAAVRVFKDDNERLDAWTKVVDILLDNKLVNNNTFVIATIATAFDQFGFLKPERKSWILPQTKTRQPAEQLVADIRSWRTSQKDSGNWYTLHSIPESHQPPGMQFQQLDEPLWSQYSTLRNTMARKAAAVNALGVNNMNNMNNMNSMNNPDRLAHIANT